MEKLSRDVTYTIEQLKNKQDKQSRKKKVNDIRNVTYIQICGFRFCANAVNQGDICTEYAPSVDAAWLKVIYSAYS